MNSSGNGDVMDISKLMDLCETKKDFEDAIFCIRSMEQMEMSMKQTPIGASIHPNLRFLKKNEHENIGFLPLIAAAAEMGATYLLPLLERAGLQLAPQILRMLAQKAPQILANVMKTIPANTIISKVLKMAPDILKQLATMVPGVMNTPTAQDVVKEVQPPQPVPQVVPQVVPQAVVYHQPQQVVMPQPQQPVQYQPAPQMMPQMVPQMAPQIVPQMAPQMAPMIQPVYQQPMMQYPQQVYPQMMMPQPYYGMRIAGRPNSFKHSLENFLNSKRQ